MPVNQRIPISLDLDLNDPRTFDSEYGPVTNNSWLNLEIRRLQKADAISWLLNKTHASPILIIKNGLAHISAYKPEGWEQE